MRVLTAGNMYPPHHYGGYELVWQSAVDHLRSAGHDVRVLTTDVDTGATEPDPPHVFRDLRWHLRGTEWDRPSPRQTLALARHNHGALDGQLDDFRPDVVAWWSMGGLTLTMLETVRRSGIPAVAFVHDEWLGYGRVVDPWLRMFSGPRRARLAALGERLSGIPTQADFGAAATYVFVSDFIRRHAIDQNLGIAHAEVAHSGIHPDFLDPAPERDWEWRLLYAGRLDHRKGIDTAVEALAHLPPQAHLTVVGGSDGAERTRLEQLAERLGVVDRVTLAGQRDRAGLAEAYGDADAVVFPVRWDEPWGLVPLEAMARGRPVVATGRGGSAEYLRDGENCLLFDAGDADGLAAAVRRLAGDESLRARLRERGLATAPNHTEDVLNAAVERELETAVGTRPAAVA
jgi:glycosyltransferase involved in cell wall biosynthesis